MKIDGAGKRLIYTHNGLSARNDSFTYIVTDTEGMTSNTATVTLSIPFDFAAWSTSIPGAGGSGTANADGDLYPDLLEFALGGSPQSGAFEAGEPLELVEESGAISFTVRRPVGLSGVRYEIFTSPDLATWTAAGSPVISPYNDLHEKLTFHGLEGRPGLDEKHGFARLKVTLEPSGESAVTLPLGWLSKELGAGTHTLGNPFRTVLFSSKVTSITANKIKVAGDAIGTTGYVEITSGNYEGRRFDVSSISGNELQLVGNIPNLTGASLVLCQHDTLEGIFQKDQFMGSTNPGDADQVQFYLNDGINQPKFELFYLLDARPGNQIHQWRAFVPGGGDRGGRVVGAGEGMFVKRQPGVPTTRIVLRGQVRANAFYQQLREGINLTSSPFPLRMTPRQRGMCDPLAGFSPSTNVGNADHFQIMQQGTFRIFYLLDHPTLPDPWRETVPGSPDYSNTDIFVPTEAAFIKRHQASPLYLIPLPWTP